MIKMLGVYFNYDTQTRLKANCESIFKSIQGTLITAVAGNVEALPW